jgi:hypothetical protein
MTSHALHAVAGRLAGWFAPVRRWLDGLERRLERLPVAWWVGPAVLLALSVLFIGAAVYGSFFARPPITVKLFDAGTVDHFAIGKVTAFPQYQLYLIGMEDGTIRAIDARVEADGCVADWRPDDPRGTADNPGHAPGAFVDPCGPGVWSAVGDAVSGTSTPLRTPQVSGQQGADGRQHVMVEMINNPAFP